MKRRSKKSNDQRKSKRGGATGGSGQSAKPLVLSRPRKWAFRLIALIGIPLILFGGLEAALRLAGYGYRTGFFQNITIGNKHFVTENNQFSLRFFPPSLTRTANPILIKAKKPPGTYRIFILGGSAAMGDPEPAFGAGRYLKALLSERYPHEHFEIINTAITAINSHVVLPIARACARQHGNLWIIYMGNNEMVGPFGAATVFGAKAPPWWLVRLNLELQKTRVGQLLMATVRKLTGQSRDFPSWGGMEMFSENRVLPDDPRRQTVYDNFQHNLTDILKAGLHSGADILLSTVAVNLKDCPPFASLTASNVPVADRISFGQDCAEGISAAQKGDFAQAAIDYGKAGQIAPQNAEVQYQWGQSLLHLTNLVAAREHLQRACDEDALPFRADSRINGILRKTGERFAGAHLELFDAVTALRTNTATGILGDETFYEHVHFNFDGNYHLARAWAKQIEPLLPPAIRTQSASTNWASRKICERRLGLTDWNRYLVFNAVLERFRQPPLDNQPNNAARMAALKSRVKELRAQMNAGTVPIARKIYEESIQKSPEDYYLHEGFAEFLQATGNLPGAVTQWQQVLTLMPNDDFANFQIGHLYNLQGRWTEAQSQLLQMVKLRPTFGDGWLELGKSRFGQKQFDLALQNFDRAAVLSPGNPVVFLERGRVLSLLKRPADSIASFRQAIKLNPNYWEAHYLLGGELGFANRFAEAQQEFEAAIELKPDYAPAHFNLGVALMKQGRLADAARAFKDALRLEPDNKTASTYLQQAQALLNQRH